jgi:hypothetical protein
LSIRALQRSLWRRTRVSEAQQVVSVSRTEAAPVDGPSTGMVDSVAVVAIAFTALSAALSVAAIAALAARPWVPSFDDALIWLRALDVGTIHAPLAGPYSRFGWDHPGPMLFYVMAVPLSLFGRSPTSVLVGAFLIALVSILGTVLAIWRRVGPVGTIAWSVGCGVLCVGLADRVIDPWNPFVLVLPFTLFVAACWMWSAGERLALPIAAVTGSFAVQAHVGVAVAVLLIAATAAAIRVGATRRESPKASLAIPVGTLVLTAVLWSPPLWQQLTEKPGNFAQIARFFFGKNADPALGWTAAVGIAAREFGPWGSWTGYEPLGLVRDIEAMPPLLLVVPIVTLGMTVLLALRWHDGLMLRLAILVASGLVATLYSYSHVHGVPYGYLLVWPRAIAMLCWFTPIILVLRRRFRSGLQPKRSSSLLAITLASLCMLLSVRSWTATAPDGQSSRMILRFAPEIIRAAPRKALIRVVATGIPFTVSPEAIAIVLIRAGRLARLQPWETRVPGKHRCVPGSAPLPTVALASGPGIEEVRQRGGRMLAEYDPLTPETRTEARRLRDLLEPQFREAKREDLISALNDGAHWLPLVAPHGIDRKQLQAYLALAGGDDHRAYAVFFFDNTTW